MRLHFVGIGGSGISGVARLAEQFGNEVSGCDLEASTAYGKMILQGHDPKHIVNSDLVITSPALFYGANENPEIAEAKKLGKLMTWQEFLGKVLLKDKKVICIAGTHGKSTTTAMAGKLLVDAGLDPIVVVGATVPEWGGNSRFGKGDYAVVEADEFNNNFLFYKPEIAIITNIEFDHPDFFKNMDDVQASFRKFTNNLIGRKLLITEKDSLAKIFKLQLLGKHNQKNANMVYLLGKALGIKEEQIIRSIESFTGIGRRLELIADRGGIKVFDDYAHHPTAIAATLEGLRQEFPNAKILVIDEPHGYKRTKTLLKDYKGVFDAANKVIIGPIFLARDKKDDSITPELVAQTSGHKDAVGLDSFDKVIENCKLIIANYNVVVIMGAGKSYLWAREIAQLLPVAFSDLTTFRIGGKIHKYSEVKNLIEIKSAIEYAKHNKLPIFIIGDGSDILVSDKDFFGVVVKYTGQTVSFKEDGTVTAEAGANWDKLVEESVLRNYQGIECLSGIPGTVGAAPIQNIGAYGQELKDSFVSLKAVNIKTGKSVIFNKADCEFSYRQSIFKTPDYWQKYIITDVTLKLIKDGSPLINYDSLINHLADKGITDKSLVNIRKAVLQIRAGKFENPKLIGNAGSFFKNPIIDLKLKTKLELKYPDLRTYVFGDKFKIAAGWILEKAGWKGRGYKSAGVSAMHALILINKTGKATAGDVFELSEKIIADVQKKFGIKLEREVQLINFQ